MTRNLLLIGEQQIPRGRASATPRNDKLLEGYISEDKT